MNKFSSLLNKARLVANVRKTEGPSQDAGKETNGKGEIESGKLSSTGEEMAKAGEIQVESGGGGKVSISTKLESRSEEVIREIEGKKKTKDKKKKKKKKDEKANRRRDTVSRQHRYPFEGRKVSIRVKSNLTKKVSESVDPRTKDYETKTWSHYHNSDAMIIIG